MTTWRASSSLEAPDLAEMTPLAGGYSGRTFVSTAYGEQVVVRIYPPGDQRGPAAPEVDAAVLRLVRGLVPVPDVLEVRREDDRAPGLLVTSWVPGERGDLVVEQVAPTDEAAWRSLGDALGTVAATLAGMPFLGPGAFVDSELTLEPLPGGDLADWVGSRLSTWPRPRVERLQGLAREAQGLLDTCRRTCLVHSDLNPKNVLVHADPARDGSVVVAGVVDWEFAHAGHPWTDLGNLLRFERQPAYVEAVLAAWAGLRGGRPDELLDGARAADLWALADLASRAGTNPGANPVADRAAAVLGAIADAGDLHAWPGLA